MRPVEQVSRILTKFLVEKTALEPDEPTGVDIVKNELAFYPLIYWPIDPTAPMPSEAAIARIDEYMTEGRTVLFDTRDQLANVIGADSASPATGRLRDVLGNLNVPPLAPVRADHVLTKAFSSFPSFSRGSMADPYESRHRWTQKTPTTVRCAPATASPRS